LGSGLGQRGSGAVTVAFTQALAVAGGAAAGGLLRWRTSLWLNTAGSLLPMGTLAVNCLGGLLMGLALSLLPRPHDDVWRLLLMTGFLGGFTTFSAFSAESLLLLQRGHFGLAALHSGAHVLGALVCAAVGFGVGEWLLERGVL
jgi:fluoride exporter